MNQHIGHAQRHAGVGGMPSIEREGGMTFAIKGKWVLVVSCCCAADWLRIRKTCG